MEQTAKLCIRLADDGEKDITTVCLHPLSPIPFKLANKPVEVSNFRLPY